MCSVRNCCKSYCLVWTLRTSKSNKEERREGEIKIKIAAAYAFLGVILCVFVSVCVIILSTGCAAMLHLIRHIDNKELALLMVE